MTRDAFTGPALLVSGFSPKAWLGWSEPVADHRSVAAGTYEASVTRGQHSPAFITLCLKKMLLRMRKSPEQIAPPDQVRG